MIFNVISYFLFQAVKEKLSPAHVAETTASRLLCTCMRMYGCHHSNLNIAVVYSKLASLLLFVQLPNVWSDAFVAKLCMSKSLTSECTT